MAEHHQEFSAATGIGAARWAAPLGEAKRALAPSAAANAKQPERRAGVKQAASSQELRQQKLDKFALGAKARRNNKLMAARAIR